MDMFTVSKRQVIVSSNCNKVKSSVYLIMSVFNNVNVISPKHACEKGAKLKTSNQTLIKDDYHSHTELHNQ